MLSRLLNAGTPLLVVGALLVFLSKKIAARWPAEKRENANLIVKGIGAALAAAGALLILLTT
jgi:hypothetical protein